MKDIIKNRRFVYDVIIPTFRGGELLNHAILSVINQTLPPRQIIIVSDAKDDVKTLFYRRYGQYNASNVVWLHTKGEEGANVARSTGVDFSKSPYIAFLDDDDEWFSKKMEIQANEMIGGGYDVSFCGFTFGVNRKRERGISNIYFEGILTHNSLGGFSGSVLKREVFYGTGGLDKKLSSCQDWDFWLRIAQAGYQISVHSSPLVFHRTHSGIQITSNPKSSFRGFRRMYFKHKDIQSKKTLIELISRRAYAGGFASLIRLRKTLSAGMVIKLFIKLVLFNFKK